MKKNKILVLTRSQAKCLEELKDLSLLDVEIFAPESEEEIKLHIKDCDIIYGIPYLISPHLHLAENLKWIQSTFAGIDALVGSDVRKDYILTNVKDVYGKIMAEYVLGYILMFEKNIIGNFENQQKKFWDQKGYPSLDGKVVGIMGTGSIGGEIAKVLKYMGMNVLGLSLSGRQKDVFHKVYSYDSMHNFLPSLDYVISVLPNTESTKGIVNNSVFSQMKGSAVFMNVGRGPNVIESDLIDAIKAKTITGAVLDVFSIEPLPEESELWNLENVFITPHVSGYDEDNSQILKILKENYNRFIGGKELLHRIDFNKGY